MTEKLRRCTVVVVAFRVAEEKSIGYRKLDTPSDSELGRVLNNMIHDKDADFVSVRVVKIDSRFPTGENRE